jgi:hypothetical protein
LQNCLILGLRIDNGVLKFDSKGEEAVLLINKPTAKNLILLLALILSACQSGPAPSPELTDQALKASNFKPSEVKRFSAEVPLAWYDLTHELVKSEKLSPPVASRIFGYEGVALYEALVPGMPDYQSLAGQLNQLEVLPSTRGQEYHWPTVVNATMAIILTDLFEGSSEATHTTIDELDNRFASQFAADLPPEIFKQSVEHGKQVGKAIAEWARTDGYQTRHNCAYFRPSGPGLWEPTPPNNAAALEPCWGKLRPFILKSTDTCDVDPPIAYSEDPKSMFYQQASEVYNTSVNLTPGQKTIALYWADLSDKSSTPAGHSISILSQVIEQQGYTLDIAAEAYARVGIAVADSFISCWKTKYEYNLLRPITHIQHVIDGAWNPLVATPPFSEYTSGHSVQSAAVAQVLTDMFGEIPFIDHTHDNEGFAPRAFKTFSEFAEEAAISRLYAGIHYRSSIERGIEQGKCIGKKVSAIQFKNP